MIPGSAEVCLSALFVDFDNVYLSLRRQSEDAAGRFARNPAEWMSRIATGGLVRFKSPQDYVRRRFAVARCYGNPGRVLVSRGGPHDPHAFATVRTNFMIAGLEVVDCQPLSTQFKNGTDIKIACDIRDFLEHPTRFGEFIILSGDADFTPVLHHLRSHDRRTVVYANESTAEIYKAFSDGWIEERDMISFLLDETVPLMLPHERLCSLAPNSVMMVLAPIARACLFSPLFQLFLPTLFRLRRPHRPRQISPQIMAFRRTRKKKAACRPR